MPSPHPSHPPYVVTLGVAGGPRIWPAASSATANPRNDDTTQTSEPTAALATAAAATAAARTAGIATAVVVDGAVYLVDAGHQVLTQLTRAGLSMSRVKGIFVTHLHSDHTIDLNNLLVFGLFDVPTTPRERITIMGPGDRGVLPPVSPRATRPPQPVAPHRPTPGIAAMVEALTAAHATDLNDRVLDALRPAPADVFAAQDIEIPESVGFHANENPSPDTEPFVIFRDERVTVSATLVVHPPIAPAFAFRFDTAHGSVTISGDTRPSENLVRLARDTDLLLHEVIDFDWVQRRYGDDQDETARASYDHHHKSHTSALQAGELATRAGARALGLHHLVPANTPHDVWRRASETFDGPLHIAEDLGIIPFGTAPGDAGPGDTVPGGADERRAGGVVDPAPHDDAAAATTARTAAAVRPSYQESNR